MKKAGAFRKVLQWFDLAFPEMSFIQQTFREMNCVLETYVPEKFR